MSHGVHNEWLNHSDKLFISLMESALSATRIRVKMSIGIPLHYAPAAFGPLHYLISFVNLKRFYEKPDVDENKTARLKLSAERIILVYRKLCGK